MAIAGKNLKFLRKLRGWTQEEFATRLGIKRSLLGAYEEERAEPRTDVLEVVSDIFKVTLDDLLRSDISEQSGGNYLSKRRQLKLTTGTTSPPAPNKPIKGVIGEEKFNEEGTILTITGNSLADNAFAAPEANGCGGIVSFLLDPIINADMGLPSPAGYNTAILNGVLQSVNAKAVRKHTE